MGQLFINLSSIITGKIVYELSIRIFKKFRGKKYTSDFLEKIFDQIIYKEDAIMYRENLLETQMKMWIIYE